MDIVFIATPLPDFCGRAVLRCAECHLVQFLRKNPLCLRCRQRLFASELTSGIINQLLRPAGSVVAGKQLPLTLKDQLCANTKRIREEKDLSQRDLATRMGTARTWLSKIETGKVEITLPGVVKLAKALEVPIEDLITDGKSVQQSAIEREIMSDPFLAEIAPLVCKLSRRSRVIFLAKLEFLATRKESAAA
jgi:transcriptional regulator with XRE-family HTH domain